MGNKGGRFAELDGLRGIAALWVVFYHFVGVGFLWLKSNPALAQAITPVSVNLQGTLAVHLFFIISGFVIFMTIRRSETILDFAVSRAARLYPAFWVSVLVASAIVIAFPVPVQHITLGEFISNLTMLHEYIRFQPVDPVYWSLSYEIGFYTLISTAFALGLVQKFEIIGCVWVTLSLVLFDLFPAIGSHVPVRVQLAFALPYASLFFAGIVFYKIWSQGFSIGRLVLVGACCVQNIYGASLLRAAIMVVVFGVFALCVSGRARWLASRPLVFLGTISYPLYLIHYSLGFRLQLLNHALRLSPPFNLLVTTLAVICAASAVTFLVERPANRVIRKAYRNMVFRDRSPVSVSPVQSANSGLSD